MWYTRSINMHRCLYHHVKNTECWILYKREKKLSAQCYKENSILAQKQNNLSFVFQGTKSF